MTTNSQNYSQAFLDKYRYWNTEDTDWADTVREDFIAKMRERGIDVDNVHWSGFCNQGDGACFEGRIVDMSLFFKRHVTDRAKEGEEALFPMIRISIDGINSNHYWWRHNGRYYHEHSLVHDAAVADFEDACGHVYDVEQMRDCGVTLWEEQYDKECEDFSTMVQDLVRDYCVELYRALNDEYDYLTSDEAVADSLYANDVHEEESEAA